MKKEMPDRMSKCVLCCHSHIANNTDFPELCPLIDGMPCFASVYSNKRGSTIDRSFIDTMLETYDEYFDDSDEEMVNSILIQAGLLQKK